MDAYGGLDAGSRGVVDEARFAVRTRAIRIIHVRHRVQDSRSNDVGSTIEKRLRAKSLLHELEMCFALVCDLRSQHPLAM